MHNLDSCGLQTCAWSQPHGLLFEGVRRKTRLARTDAARFLAPSELVLQGMSAGMSPPCTCVAALVLLRVRLHELEFAEGNLCKRAAFQSRLSIYAKIWRLYAERLPQLQGK